MTLTPQQVNVRAAITDVRHVLDVGDGTVVFVTSPAATPLTDRPSVVAVEPDGTVAAWTLSWDYTCDDEGHQKVYAKPRHFDLGERFGVEHAELVLRRTEGDPRWRVWAVVRVRAEVLSTDEYEAPPALAAALAVIYGPDVPTETTVPRGGHGDTGRRIA